MTGGNCGGPNALLLHLTFQQISETDSLSYFRLNDFYEFKCELKEGTYNLKLN